MAIRIIQTDEGWRVWNGNCMIAYTDENGMLWDARDGFAVLIGQADNSREISELLEKEGIE